MSGEGGTFERKSLRYALGKHADTSALACDCVGFANGMGGRILLGIEDRDEAPPPGQRVGDVPEKLRKRLPQLTVNVGLEVRTVTAPNGGEYVEILVARNTQSIASTTNGRYFLRVADETKHLMPDELARLLQERGSVSWELLPAPQGARIDPVKSAEFFAAVRSSERVSAFVKAKTDGELLDHYLLVRAGRLTQLGVLWAGRREDRAALSTAPVIQCLRFDDRGVRSGRKLIWDDHALSPMELIEAVWREVPEWRDAHEIPGGLIPTPVPDYDEVVVRELLANALVHRPYTTRGDIFINLHPDRMEIHNPGLLPVGVTPANILHVTVQRNAHMARIFYDLGLMEREGAGYFRIYEKLLASGRPAPVVSEGDDRVVVSVQKRIARPEILDLMRKVEREFQPSQREIIALGLVAQHESLSGLQLAKLLALDSAERLKPWIGRLRDWGVLKARGRTKGTEYQVDAGVLRRAGFKGGTSLRRIEDHRLRELVLQDLAIYERATRPEIHRRIGGEIALSKLRRVLAALVAEGALGTEGETRWRRYVLRKSAAESAGSGR